MFAGDNHHWVLSGCGNRPVDGASRRVCAVASAAPSMTTHTQRAQDTKAIPDRGLASVEQACEMARPAALEPATRGLEGAPTGTVAGCQKRTSRLRNEFEPGANAEVLRFTVRVRQNIRPSVQATVTAWIDALLSVTCSRSGALMFDRQGWSMHGRGESARAAGSYSVVLS